MIEELIKTAKRAIKAGHPIKQTLRILTTKARAPLLDEIRVLKDKLDEQRDDAKAFATSLVEYPAVMMSHSGPSGKRSVSITFDNAKDEGKFLQALAKARKMADREGATVVRQHPDDYAVDTFANAMKEKLAKKRDEGYGGWEAAAPVSFLEHLMSEQLSLLTPDPVDVANFAMMLFHRKGQIRLPVLNNPNLLPPGSITSEDYDWSEPGEHSEVIAAIDAHHSGESDETA